MKSLKLSRQLFYWVISMSLMFTVCFTAFQYRRERIYKINVLNVRLQDYNIAMGEAISCVDEADEYVAHHQIDSLRVTILSKDGKVLYDSKVAEPQSLPDHSGRKEVMLALSQGEGYDIKRNSETLGEPYFYSATFIRDKGFLIRTALPYEISLVRTLSTNNGFLWVALGLMLLLTTFCYIYTRRLGKTVDNLKSFAAKAERGEIISGGAFTFPDNDLGEISMNIVRLYARLQNSEDDKTRLKHQLTQNVAHELKTPVSSIQGYLETIISEPDMDEGTKKMFIERCYAQSSRLTDLLSDISVLNKMDDAPSTFHAESLDIHDIVESVRKDVAQGLDKKRMKFLNLTDDPLIMNGNPPLVYSIFRNLTDNAISYAGVDTTVTIRYLGSKDGLLYFNFSDNGSGVAPEHLAHLFERFYRVDKGRSRSLGGTGLGLAIVRNAVLIHGGDISVSIAPSGGLEFTFSLRA